jgi:hypothetical protein
MHHLLYAHDIQQWVRQKNIIDRGPELLQNYILDI